MVKKSTIAILAGLAIAAAALVGSPNRRGVIVPRLEPIPFAVPEPVKQPIPILVEIPLTLEEATARVKEEYDNLFYRKIVPQTRQIKFGASKFRQITEDVEKEFRL